MSAFAALVFALMGAAFYELFRRLAVMPDIRRVLEVAPAAARVIRSDSMSDPEKEAAVRKMSLEVLGDTLRFTAKIALTLALCLGIAALADRLGPAGSAGPMELLVSWQALAVAALAAALWARLRARLPGG